MNIPLELHADILIGNEHRVVWELLAQGGQLRDKRSLDHDSCCSACPEQAAHKYVF